MDESKVKESCEADGDRKHEGGVEDEEEHRVHPVNKAVDGHVLQTHFGELVEARVEEGQTTRRCVEAGDSIGGASVSSGTSGIAAAGCGSSSGVLILNTAHSKKAKYQNCGFNQT